MCKYRLADLWTLLLAEVLLLCLAMGPAYAQNCGDIIRMDTALTQDIGPCPGNGLTIERSNVVLDLNGYSIIGSGGDSGVMIAVGAFITIKGPGTIKNFGTGISSRGRGEGSDSTIRDLALQGNVVGVAFFQVARLRILDNVIDGNSIGQTG